MPFEYNKKVMQHFLKAKHVGKIDKADGIGKVGNMSCGDVMYIYIKVGKKGKTKRCMLRFQSQRPEGAARRRLCSPAGLQLAACVHKLRWNIS